MWVGVSAILVACVLAIGIGIVIHRAAPILRSEVEKRLSAQFDSRVTLESLDVTLARGLEVNGSHLAIYPPSPVAAAGATRPLFAIDHFSFRSGLLGLFFRPIRVSKIQVSGMRIEIPPREMRKQSSGAAKKPKGKMAIEVAEIVFTDSRLVIDTSKPGKDPKDFKLRRIDLRRVGPDTPWRFDAVLVNAIPRGDIQASGTFGPWQTDSPGDSSVTGKYTFQHADLSTIQGIGGTLSSIGEFHGGLDKIEVSGKTETPDFWLDTARHPMPLHTEFRATVDGTTGDTYLHEVKAKLLNSNFTARGQVVNIKGEGHRTELDVDIPRARLQDFLALAVRTQPPVMTAEIGMKTKLLVSPGKQSVSRRLGLIGGFTLTDVHFTNASIQDKVDGLSLRAQGKPKEAKPGAEDVRSQMAGRFQMAGGTITFSKLGYLLPGARVDLRGTYSLDGKTFDFDGKVITSAPLSQMVDSRVTSLFLKAISPFFKSKQGGAEIPVVISGTQSEPKFGLDVLRRHGKQ